MAWRQSDSGASVSMKLDNIHGPQKVTSSRVFNEYITRLDGLVNGHGPRLLTEGKKVIVTVDLDDDDGSIKKEAKEAFIEQAKSIGQFDNAQWVKQLINGLKQTGVQGVDHITEGDRPVTMNEVKQLIQMLVNLISK
jgi:hypothetical protein